MFLIAFQLAQFSINVFHFNIFAFNFQIVAFDKIGVSNVYISLKSNSKSQLRLNVFQKHWLNNWLQFKCVCLCMNQMNESILRAAENSVKMSWHFNENNNFENVISSGD